MYTRGGLWGETYERCSVSSWELNKRMVEPLLGIFVGVCSFGVVEYDGGAAEYPGGPLFGVEWRSILDVGYALLIREVF